MDRNRKVASALMAVLLVSACTATAPRRSYPERPFNEVTLSQVAVGIAPEALTQIFGAPDATYPMTFGSAVGQEWDGVAYRYYAAKNPLYVFADEWLSNTFYFRRAETGALSLNHWNIEHPAGLSVSR